MLFSRVGKFCAPALIAAGRGEVSFWDMRCLMYKTQIQEFEIKLQPGDKYNGLIVWRWHEKAGEPGTNFPYGNDWLKAVEGPNYDTTAAEYAKEFFPFTRQIDVTRPMTLEARVMFTLDGQCEVDVVLEGECLISCDT